MGRKEFEWDEINGKYSRGGERMVMEGKMDVTERG
jgi:hypothetical protein